MGNGATQWNPGHEPCTLCAHAGQWRWRAGKLHVVCLAPEMESRPWFEWRTGCRYWAASGRPDRAAPDGPQPGIKVIVTGGRDFFDRAAVYRALDRADAKRLIGTLVHGGAPGADTLAGDWAKEREVQVQIFAADWARLHSKAGPVRNQAMADAGAAGCIAFPGGKGTADCVRRCAAARIPVWKPYG